MPGLGVNFDVEMPSYKRRKREEAKADLALKLLDRGYTPEEANSAAEGYATTGNFALPTEVTKSYPTEGPVDASGQGPAPYTETKPIRFGGQIIGLDDTGHRVNLTPSDADYRGTPKFVSLEGGSKSYSTEQMEAIESGDPEKMAVAFPNGVPKDAFAHAISWKTAKETHDAASSTKDAQQQDKLEGEYRTSLEKVINSRSGGLGLQDAKVNQAVHLRQMANSYYDPESGQFNIPPAQYMELVLGLATLLSPTGTPAESTIQELKTNTAKGDFAGALTYLTGTPQTGSTQDVLRNLIDSIDRQGQVSEKLRDKYMDGIRKLAPSRLEPSRREMMEKINLANSFSEVERPDKQGDGAKPLTATNKKTGEKIISMDGGQTWQKAQ